MRAAACVKLGTLWIVIVGESDDEEAWGAAGLCEESRQTDAETRLVEQYVLHAD